MKKFLLFLMATMLTTTVTWGQNAATIFNGKPLANSYTNGVFLYNVGTGCLLIHGGDYGTQARVFYQNWGDLLHLQSVNTTNRTAIVQTNQGYFAANVPAGTDPRKYGNDITQVWQPIMDHGSTALTFTRVAGETGTSTYTYHISHAVGGTTYYIGAAYGIKYNKDATGNSDEILGYMYDIGHDECTYTTQSYATASTTYSIGSGTGVSAKDLYSWRIISFDDLQAAVTSGTSGLAANISYRINDQDFSRNYPSFYTGTSGVSPSDAWVVKNTRKTSSYDSSTLGRFNYTWGFTADGQRQRHADWYGTITNINNTGLYTSDQYWYQPLRLKEQFGDDWVWGYHLYNYTSHSWTEGTTQGNNITYGQKKDIKYGFMSFEGVGAVASYVTAPVDGIYEISCVGFSQPGEGANHDPDGYLFATIGESKIASMYNGEEDDEAIKTSLLYQVPAGTYDRSSYMECMGDASLFTANGVTPAHPAHFTSGAGYELTRNQPKYTTSVLIEAKAGEKIYFGAAKDYGTKTKGYVKTNQTITRCKLATQSNVYLKVTGTSSLSLASTDDETEASTFVIDENNHLYYESNGFNYYLVYTGNSSNGYYVSLSTSSTNYMIYSQNYGIRCQPGSYYYYMMANTTNNRLYRTSDNSYNSSNLAYPAESSIETIIGKTEVSGSYANYYFDGDWVAVDNFQVTYVGNPLLVLDEDEQNISYLRKYNHAGSVIDRTTYEMTTVQMERTFAEGNWNSFVCPIDLTSKQVKEAFGSEVDLAELVQIGSLSGSRTCIDFKKVQLPANDQTAITAGKMYLIKPVAGSGHYIDGKKRYTLGANFKIFIDGGDAASTSSYENNIQKSEATTNGYTILSANNPGWTTSKLIESEVIEGNGGAHGENDVDGIYYKATYVNSGDNKIVPAGSYVMGAKYTENTENIDETTVTMYHLKNDMAIKGFRGWLEDWYNTTTGEVVARIYPTEDFDPATMIEEVDITAQVKGVLDMSGRKIATDDLNALPKGLYIVNGKKVYVK